MLDEDSRAGRLGRIFAEIIAYIFTSRGNLVSHDVGHSWIIMHVF